MTQRRVLIVDDDARIGRLARRVTESLGFETRMVDDPVNFEGEYEGFAPDVILLDLKMDTRDGVEILRWLADRYSQASIILVSGMDERIIDTTRRLGQSLGLNIPSILQKPLAIADLRKVLEDLTHPVAPTPSSIQLIAQEDLEHALAQGQIIPYYQPQVDLDTLRVCGVEVLARWQHPAHGLIPPADFIGLAEGTGLIGRLTFHLLGQALTDVNFLRASMPEIGLSLNLSPLLLDDLKLPDQIVGLLGGTGVEPAQLTLEITESGRMSAPPRSMDILTRFRLRGIQLSNDDLGKGYASVDQLYRLPYSEIKVDRDFVIDALKSPVAAAIVRSTIELGKRLKLRVVAEGIESWETLVLLRDLGCDVGQGHHIARPMPLREVLQWLEAWNPQAQGPGSGGEAG